MRRGIDTLTHVSPSGISHPAPEIQLFYKAKSPRPKDEIDSDAALPLLSAVQRRWPADAITITRGSPARLGRLTGNDISPLTKG